MSAAVRRGALAKAEARGPRARSSSPRARPMPARWLKMAELFAQIEAFYRQNYSGDVDFDDIAECVCDDLCEAGNWPSAFDVHLVFHEMLRAVAVLAAEEAAAVSS